MVPATETKVPTFQSPDEDSLVFFAPRGLDQLVLADVQFQSPDEDSLVLCTPVQGTGPFEGNVRVSVP